MNHFGLFCSRQNDLLKNNNKQLFQLVPLAVVLSVCRPSIHLIPTHRHIDCVEFVTTFVWFVFLACDCAFVVGRWWQYFSWGNGKTQSKAGAWGIFIGMVTFNERDHLPTQPDFLIADELERTRWMTDQISTTVGCFSSVGRHRVLHGQAARPPITTSFRQFPWHL